MNTTRPKAAPAVERLVRDVRTRAGLALEALASDDYETAHDQLGLLLAAARRAQAYTQRNGKPR